MHALSIVSNRSTQYHLANLVDSVGKVRGDVAGTLNVGTPFSPRTTFSSKRLLTRLGIVRRNFWPLQSLRATATRLQMPDARTGSASSRHGGFRRYSLETFEPSEIAADESMRIRSLKARGSALCNSTSFGEDAINIAGCCDNSFHKPHTRESTVENVMRHLERCAQTTRPGSYRSVAERVATDRQGGK